jgi:hypothetical protein
MQGLLMIHGDEAEAAVAARQRAAGLATDPAVRRFLPGPG